MKPKLNFTSQLTNPFRPQVRQAPRRLFATEAAAEHFDQMVRGGQRFENAGDFSSRRLASKINSTISALASGSGSLVAVSPQTLDNLLTPAEKNDLAFPVLSDSSLEAVRRFGVAFTMPVELAELYKSVGHDLPAQNGNGQ